MTEILTSVDRADMLGAIDSLPEQLERSAAAALASDVRSKIHDRIGATPPRALVVCGMGGSGVGADLLGACAELHMPVIPVKGYDLPDWVGPDDAVICVSYSGATAETLSCVRQTIQRSRLVAAVTSGGELAAIATTDVAPSL